MIVILFQRNKLCGGYGDRLVGIVSVYMIAKLLGREFKICWEKEDIEQYLDFTKYSISNLTTGEHHNFIDRRNQVGELLKKGVNIFANPITILNVNQEIASFFYKSNFHNEIYEAYHKLYDEILKPKKIILDGAKALNKGYIIGIQIRTGDVYMGGGVCFIENVEKYVKKIFNKIENQNKEIKDRVYFITSDNEDPVKIIKNMGANVIYYDKEIKHLDRKPKGDFSKVVFDNYFLAKYCKKMYISEYSNYGRTAALISKSNEIYDLDCKLLGKESLLAKK